MRDLRNGRERFNVKKKSIRPSSELNKLERNLTGISDMERKPELYSLLISSVNMAH